MTLVVSPHFRTGLVDDTFRYRVDWENYTTSLLTALNWDVLDSGAIRRRAGFRRVQGVNNPDWTAVSTWNSSYNTGIIPFIRSDGRKYIVFVEKDPSPSADSMSVRVYDVVSHQFQSVTSPTVSPIRGQKSCDDIQYAQVGDSLFFIPATDDTKIEFVMRLYYDWTLFSPHFELEKVQAEGELTGLWSALADDNKITPTFLGEYDSAGAAIAASAAAANYVAPADEIAVGDEVYFERAWHAVTAIQSAPTYAVEHNAFSHREHLANAKVRYRYDPSYADINAIYARALAFFEGRLCLGRVMHVRRRGRATGIESGPTRLRCSRSNDPFLLVPSLYNSYDDSPIDAVLSAPNLRAITWLAGGRVLYIGGANGIVVVKSGLTPKSIQTVTVDTIGTCATPPVVEQSGILYIDSSRNLLMRLRYQDTSDGYISIALNKQCSEKLNGFKRVIVSSGKGGATRRIFALRNNGKLAVCSTDEDGQPYGWSEYQIGPANDTFFIDDICDLDGVLYATVLSSGLGLGTRKLLVFLENISSNYVGDFRQAASLSGGHWTVTNKELLDCTVGVTGVLTGTSTRVNLGVFKTTASGIIENESGTKLDELFSLSAVDVYRIFESVARPMPAIPQDSDGAGFGRNYRVSKVHIGVINTRQIVVDGQIVQPPLALASQHGVERPAVTGWLDVGKTGYDADHDLRIEGSGIYAATVAGLSREVQ